MSNHHLQSVDDEICEEYFQPAGSDEKGPEISDVSSQSKSIRFDKNPTVLISKPLVKENEYDHSNPWKPSIFSHRPFLAWIALILGVLATVANLITLKLSNEQPANWIIT